MTVILAALLVGQVLSFGMDAKLELGQSLRTRAEVGLIWGAGFAVAFAMGLGMFR